MDAPDVLADGLERVRHHAAHAVRDLGPDALAWRPDEHANSIAWLVWHLARIQDVQVAALAGTDPVWDEVDATAFGLPADSDATGFGDGPDEVARIRPASADILVDHCDRVTERSLEYVAGLSADDLDDVVDRNWDPPVTRGVRLVSVIGDGLQHAGQAAYVRGLWQRR